MTAMPVTTAVRFQALPPLSPDEYQALEQSIAEHGVMVPIIVDEHGVVIDGHHRLKIASDRGIFCPTRTVRGLDDAAKRTMALSLNLDRRHLTREQRRALVAESIKADPQLSDREHGRRTGVSHPTVAAVRDELETAGDVESFSTREDSAGRSQPASKPPRSEPEVPEQHLPPLPENYMDNIVAGESAQVGARPAPKPSQKEPSTPRRRPLTDAAREIGLDLKNLTSRMERLLADDRFARNKDEVAPHLRHYLVEAIKVCQDLNHQINP